MTRIRQKLIFYFFTLIAISILMVAVVNSVVSSRSLEQQANDYTEAVLNQVQRNIDTYIDEIEGLIDMIAFDDAIIGALEDEEHKDQTEGNAAIYTEMNKLKELHPEIAGILLVSKEDKMYSYDMTRIKRDALTSEVWYVNAKGHPGKIQLFSSPIGRNIKVNSSYSADDVISVSKAIFKPENGEFMGVLLVDIRSSKIKEVIDSVAFGKKGFVYVMEEDGDKVYAPVNPIVYRINESWVKKYPSGFVKKINEGNYQIIYNYSSKTKWYMMGVFSLDETLKSVVEIKNYTFIISLIALSLATSIALILAISIARPISDLRTLMKKAEEGDLTVQFLEERQDEIGDLGHSFNAMMVEINNLLQLVYKEQKSKREAELKMLQSQINPHFLYNTLDTIQWMAMDNEGEEIIKIIESLTRVFRIGLSKGREMISLREEIQHVSSYLTIQKVRYSDRMDYTIDIEESILEEYVPKLILQPLVENSIYHGVKEKRGQGHISIEGKRIKDQIHLIVTDDGAGIEHEKLSLIRERLDGIKKRDQIIGYGLFNVHERLQLTFGDAYNMVIKSVLGKGTEIRLIMTLTKEGKAAIAEGGILSV